MSISISVAGITLEGVEQPYPYPTPAPRRRVETVTLRPGQSAPGRRIVSDMGSDDSYSDLEFSCRRLTAAHVASFRSSFATWPPATVTVIITDDSGTTTYTCAWAENGFSPERTTYDANLWRGQFRFHVLEAS